MKIKLKFYVGLLLLNSAVVLFCMEETNDLYCKRCSAININQEQKLSDFIEKSYKTNPKAAIQKIQHKLVIRNIQLK